MPGIFEGWLPEGLEVKEPNSAFYRGISNRFGMQNPEQNIYGQHLLSQAPRYGTAFRFNQLLNPPAQASPNDFEQFVNWNSPSALPQTAFGLFGQLVRGGSSLPYQQFAQPTDDQASALGGLAQLALQSRISPLALSLLDLPSGGDLRTQFVARNPSGSGNFIDFVRQKLGLGLL